jgi:serine/threonine-protein kinase ULK4
LILEFSTGGDLLAMLRADHSMPEYSCQKFASDILAGLQYVHSKGYIYADLKPSNILVNEYGTLMLCDFGLARKVQQEENDASKDPQKAAEESNKRGSPYCEWQAQNAVSTTTLGRIEFRGAHRCSLDTVFVLLCRHGS